ncbi:MAG TPA: serine protease [Polyangiaceae bacterium]
MRTAVVRSGALAGLGLLSASVFMALPARAEDLNAEAVRARVRAATVTLPKKGCAGAIVQQERLVVTAAHCVPRRAQSVTVRLPDQRAVESSVLHLDRTRDVALLELAQGSGATPLELLPDLPTAGGRVLFVGRIDRSSRAQSAEIQRVGKCPSLPGIEDAVFTNIQAKPGDSGSPVVDESLRVVGVIHGGSACHIVAPTASLTPAIAAAQAGLPVPDPAPSEAEATPSPALPNAADEPALRRYQVGPFVFERIANGFRFKFDFDFRVGSEE